MSGAATTPGTHVGRGAWRFRFDDAWARLPRGVELGITHGVAIDGAGHVHVLHTNRPGAAERGCVLVFTPEGEFVRAWGPGFEGSGHGLHLTEERGGAFAYVTDLRRGLFKTTLEGETVWRLEKPDFFGPRPHLPWQPTNVAVTPGGDVFLADGYGSYLVFRLDPEGRVVDVIGGPGGREHHLAHPHGLIYTERLGRPALLVAENIATRLNYLDLDGVHLGFLGVETRRPRHFDEREGVLAVPDFYGRVTLIGPDDRAIAHLGDGWDADARAPRCEAEGRPPRPGEFGRPHDACFDAEGNLYVVEYREGGRIVKLTRDPEG